MPLSLEAQAAIGQAGFAVFYPPSRHWVDRDEGHSAHEIISNVLARDAARALLLRRVQRMAGNRPGRVCGHLT